MNPRTPTKYHRRYYRELEPFKRAIDALPPSKVDETIVGGSRLDTINAAIAKRERRAARNLRNRT